MGHERTEVSEEARETHQLLDERESDTTVPADNENGHLDV